jgi:hypothetical protein
VAIEVAGLLAVNVEYLIIGVAAFAALGWLTRDPSTWYRVGAAYPFGLALVVVPTSYLALLGVAVPLGATLVAVIVCAAAVLRTRPWIRLSRPVIVLRGRFTAGALAGTLLGLVLAVLLIYATRTFATRPLIEWDSWVIWMSKAKLLYEDPTAAPAALRSGSYGRAPYPLALPTLEAMGFSAMGRFDGTVIGLQFLLLGCGFPIALWSLTRGRARAWMVALAALAIVAAPQMLFQLMTRYADVPLGLFVGLGLAAGAAWLLSGQRERWLLGCFVAFLGMAGLTKLEGFLFALAGVAALAAGVLATGDRQRLRQAAIAAGALIVVILPWRLYCSAYGLSMPEYSLGHATDPSYLSAHADRLRPTVVELWTQLTTTQNWGLLTWVILLALVVGLAGAQWHLLAFTGTWLVLAAGGLLLTYWISTLPVESHLTNSSYRTIVSLLVGGAALVPLFVFPRAADDPLGA